MSKAQNQDVKQSANTLSRTSNEQMLPYIASLTGQQSGVQSGQQLPSFTGAYNTFTGGTQTGGFDPTAYQNTLQGYNAMANTGGFTPEQSRQYMDQATSGVANTYNVLGQQLQQNKAKTGGLGGSGETAQLARQLGQAQAQAEQGAAVGLNQQINANKLSGLSGAASLQSTQAGNKLASAQGLSGLYNVATGEISDLGKQVLGAMGINWQNQAEALQALTALATSSSSSKGILDTIGQIGGMVSGALTGLV